MPARDKTVDRVDIAICNLNGLAKVGNLFRVSLEYHAVTPLLTHTKFRNGAQYSPSTLSTVYKVNILLEHKPSSLSDERGVLLYVSILVYLNKFGQLVLSQ
jgi:hypothetical protein